MLPDIVLYSGFAVVVAALLAVDLFVVHREAHAVSLREAGVWSAIWIGCAVAFGLAIPRLHASPPGENATVAYFTSYVIEKSLSVDNVFLFILIFEALSVPQHLQHRVLFYGVVGAIVMRTVLIFTGTALIEQFRAVLYLFGAFLIFTGVQTWRHRRETPEISDSKVLKWIKRIVPSTERLDDERFFVREHGRLLATPLFVVLALVEFSDLVFAMDSIPAVFAVTRDPFVVLTSNIFAILGLRALYFLLAGVAGKLRYLKAGLAVILTYIGFKLVYERLHDDVALMHNLPGINPLVSFAIIMGILAVAVVASLRRPLEPGEPVPSGVGPFEERHRHA